MKNQNRFYKLLLGVALIAEIVCFAPDIEAQNDVQKYKDIDSIKAILEKMQPIDQDDNLILTPQGKSYTKEFFNQFWALLNEYIQKTVVKENRRVTFEDFIMWMANKWDYVNLRKRGAKSN